MDEFVALVLLVEGDGDLLLDGVDALLELVLDDAAEHLGDAVEVDLHLSHLGVDGHLHDGLAHEAEPAAAQVVDDEAQPQHAVELLDDDLEADGDVDEGHVGGRDLHQDASAEGDVEVDDELPLLGVEFLRPQQLGRLPRQLEVLDVDLLQALVVVLVERDVDLLGEGGAEELALRPLGVGHEEEAVEQRAVLLGEDVARLQPVLVLVGEVLGDLHLGGVEQVVLERVLGEVGGLAQVVALALVADHLLLVVDELDEGHQQDLLHPALVLLVHLLEVLHAAYHLLRLLVDLRQLRLHQAVTLPHRTLLHPQPRQDAVRLLVASADQPVHLQQLRLVLPLQRQVHPLQVVDDLVDAARLQAQLLVEDAEVDCLPLPPPRGQVQVEHQLAVDPLQPHQELVEALQVVQDQVDLALVVVRPLEVLLVVAELGSDDLVHVLGLDHLLDLGGAGVPEVVGVALLPEDGAEGPEAFLEADGVGVEEGDVPGDDDAVVAVLLLLVEGGDLAGEVAHLLHAPLVAVLVLLDAQRQVRELEVLLLQPVHHVAVVLAAPLLRLVLLQVLLLLLQVNQVLTDLLQAAHRVRHLLLQHLVVLEYLPPDHLHHLRVGVTHLLDLLELRPYLLQCGKDHAPRWQHDLLAPLTVPAQQRVLGGDLGTLQLDLQLIEGPALLFSELRGEGVILEVGLELGKGVGAPDQQGAVRYGLDPHSEKDERLVELVEASVLLLHLLDVFLDFLLAGDLVEGQVLQFLLKGRRFQHFLLVVKEGFFSVAIQVDLVVDHQGRERVLHLWVHVVVCMGGRVLSVRRMVKESRQAFCTFRKQQDMSMKDSRKMQREKPSQKDQILALVQAKMMLIPGTNTSISSMFRIVYSNIIIAVINHNNKESLSFLHYIEATQVQPYKIIKITMQELIRHSYRIDLGSDKKEGNLKAFPAIEQRKFSLNVQTDMKYHTRFSKLGLTEESSLFNNTASKSGQPSHQSIFSIPKNFSLFKKRVYIMPHRFASKQQASQALESEEMKKQIEALNDLQRGNLSREQILFNAAFNQFGLADKESLSSTHKTTNVTRHSRKKKPVDREKGQMITISTQGGVKKSLKTLDFFSIEKMNLLSSEKMKKSTSLFFKLNEQEGGLSQPDSATPGRTLKELQAKLVRNRQVLMLGMAKEGDNPDIHNEPEEDLLQTVATSKPSSEKRDKSANKSQIAYMNSRRDFPIKYPVLEKQRNHSFKVKRKFNPPFDTYLYRSFIWKANFSNQRGVEIPPEYEKKFKVFVGKGNNSCMVIGLISRRPWLTITDKIEEANFVWTQLKQLSYFKKQQSLKQVVKIEQRSCDSYLSGSILTQSDTLSFDLYFSKYFTLQQRIDERLACRIKYFRPRKIVKSAQIDEIHMQNHLINNYVLGNKKALFTTMSNYYKEMKVDVFSYLPLTFHIKDGLEDPKFYEFLKHYHKRAKEIASNEGKDKKKEYNAWIVKPGQNSNRGHGIKMCLQLDQIRALLKKRQRYADGSYRTFIVQAYIQRPLLYNRRKFDLRHYIMITSINGIIKGYWYKDGYVRTTSSEYSLANNLGSVHLTNDAVQKNLPEYGKYEKGNKISYEELSSYIEKYSHKSEKGFYTYIYPRMKKIATDAMKACSASIDPTRLENNFEIFGMDFMIDADLEVWLIQINTNPCLELSCPLLGSIIPKMVENALQLSLDAMIPPPVKFSSKGMHFYKDLQKQNKFQLVFDQRVEKPFDGSLQALDQRLLQEEDDTFEDCGENWQQEK